MNARRIIPGSTLLRSAAVLRRPPQLVLASRTLHRTNVYYKKKQISQNNEDGLEIEEEDLFASPTESETPVKSDLASSAPRSHAAKLIEARTKYFRKTKEELTSHPAYKNFVDLRSQNPDISRLVNPSNKNATFKPSKLKHAPARAKLSRLIVWAGTRADLLEIVDILRVYRAKQWSVDDLNRLDFIGRCRTLKAPDIALAVLYHRPKFGIDIPSLSSARALMHSLLVTPYPPPNAGEAPLPDDLALPTSTPFTHALLLANLFDLYALPPVETDQVARALLLGECVQQFNKGEDVEDANTIVQKVREWAESQKTPADAGSVVLNERDPRVKDGKLVATSAAIKARGKVAPDAAPKDPSFYDNGLTRDERTWVQLRLEKFIQWAEKEGQDTSWVEKLKAAAW